MPTVITHALVGASTLVFKPKLVSPLKVAVVASVLAIFPDIDVVGFRNGIAYSDMLGHRGLTHSLPFAAMLSFVVVLLFFRHVPRFSAAFWGVAVLLFVATASHGLLDAFTDAGLGVGLLLPFDETRYFAPWRPLTASPLSISRFFSDSGAEIMLNEIRWVWAPVAAIVIVTAFVRRVLRRVGP